MLADTPEGRLLDHKDEEKNIEWESHDRGTASVEAVISNNEVTSKRWKSQINTAITYTIYIGKEEKVTSQEMAYTLWIISG